MNKSIDYAGLVLQAQLGDKECLNRLAESARERLYAYVYRYTLAEDMANDIVQESILKMIQEIDQLREAEQFWPWIYKIALNKIHNNHRQGQQQRNVLLPENQRGQRDNEEVIANLVYEEFKGLCGS